MNGSEALLVKTESSLKGIDPLGLYEQSLVVDPVNGQITILTPITAGRIRDVSRPIRFFSSVTVTVRGMAQAVPFEIEAGSLSEAVQKWLEVASSVGKKAIEEVEAQMFKSRLQVPAAARMAPAKPN